MYADLNIYHYGDSKIKCGLLEMTSNLSQCVHSKEAIAQELATKYCQNCPKVDIENIENKIKEFQKVTMPLQNTLNK